MNKSIYEAAAIESIVDEYKCLVKIEIKVFDEPTWIELNEVFDVLNCTIIMKPLQHVMTVMVDI